jgi:hypothetical protein
MCIPLPIQPTHGPYILEGSEILTLISFVSPSFPLSPASGRRHTHTQQTVVPHRISCTSLMPFNPWPSPAPTDGDAPCLLLILMLSLYCNSSSKSKSNPFAFCCSPAMTSRECTNQNDSSWCVLRRHLRWSYQLGVQASAVLMVYFGTPSMFITLWFGFDYGTNPPLGTLII